MALFQRMGAAPSVSSTKFSLEAFSVEEEAYEAGEATATPLADAAAQGEGDTVEAAVDAAEVSTDVDVMQESINALEDGEEIATVQDQVENATENDIQNAAAQQAMVMQQVEGRDSVDATTAPATESRVGGKISTEGFKEWLKAAWEKVKEFAANIYHKIKMIWKKFVNGTGRLQKRAKALKDKMKDKKDKLKDAEAKITYHSTILAKTESGKFAPENAKDAAALVLTEAKKIEGDLKDAVGAVKKGMGDLLDKSKVKDYTESQYATAVTNAEKALVDVGKGTDFSMDKRFGQRAKAKYDAMTFGNKAFFYVVGGNNETIGAALNSFTARFETLHSSFSGGKTKDNEHAPLSAADIKDIAGKVEDAAKELEKFFDKGTGNVDKEIDKLKEDISKAVKEAAEQDDYSSYGKEAVKGVQRAYVVPTQLLRAAVNYASYLVQLAGAALTVAEISADKYEDSKKD